MTEVNDTNSDEFAYGDTIENYAYGSIVGVSNYTYRYDTRSSVGNHWYMLKYALLLWNNLATRLIV